VQSTQLQFIFIRNRLKITWNPPAHKSGNRSQKLTLYPLILHGRSTMLTPTSLSKAFSVVCSSPCNRRILPDQPQIALIG